MLRISQVLNIKQVYFGENDIYLLRGYLVKADVSMKLNEAVSKRLTELLDERKMTAYALFIKSGVSQSTISDLKNMNNSGVNITIIYELCEGLGIGLKDFFDSPLFERENIID